MSSASDETDLKLSKLFGRKKKTEPNDDAYQKTEIAKDADIYNMEHYKRGLAIIFNHYEFMSELIKKREGTQKDVDALTEVFENLRFDVCVFNDYTYEEMSLKLTEVSEKDHSDSDCLVIAVLTHGGEGKLYANDYPYLTDELWSPFAGDKCPTLAGKPKIFFIQASRGVKVDVGVRSSFIATDSSSSSTYKLPVMADILIMYSSYDGYCSWTDPSSGSWFIQCLCEELKRSARIKDILGILTTVNRRMALEFEADTPSMPEFDGMKQIGSIVSTCTRLLYFYSADDKTVVTKL